MLRVDGLVVCLNLFFGKTVLIVPFLACLVVSCLGRHGHVNLYMRVNYTYDQHVI